MTAAQKKNVERFKKAAAEAKKLRAKNPKLTQAEAVKKAYANLYGSAKKAAPKKKVGAIKIIEKGENKSSKVTKVLQQKRSKKGTFKGYKTLSGTKTHKDTKSHNVNIRVVSGIGNVLEDAKERRNKLIDRISKLNADIFYLMDDQNIKTATQRGRRNAVVSIYKKSIANYKKELKLLDKIISDTIAK
jgi:hypothetical protein